MAGSIDAIRKAIVDGAPGDAIGALALPETMRAAFIRKDEREMFRGMDPTAKDPRKSIHVDEVPTPPLGPNECLIAVMASAINYNTVWSSIFDPVPTFAFLEKLGLESDLGARHDLDYHILGSDASGVILKTGPGVTRWKPGDQVTVHCNYVDLEAPTGHDDSMLDPNQRIWGFESNFGGLADIAMVKANQLMPKPRHLTWEEAACLGLVSSTAYRMLVSGNGARMKQGDIVLIWGATGGLGGFACQYVLNGGGVPVAVVSSAEKCQLLQSIGVEHIIDRKAEELQLLERRRAGPERVAALRQTDPLARGRGPRHRLRAPRTADLRCKRVRCEAWRNHRDVCVDLRIHAHLRQPLPVDAPQEDHRFALRQLQRGVGSQPSRRTREDPPDPVDNLSTRGDR